MSNRTRVTTASLVVAATLLLGGLSSTAWAQQAPAESADAAAGGPAAGPAAAAPVRKESAADNPITSRGLAPPPTPLQTAGALLGALFAIALAIAGVTLTFKSMRNERRGRGRSRRPARSERDSLPQT